MEINQNILNLWFNIFFSAILSTNTSAWQGENGEMFQQQQKNIRPPRGVVVANGHGLECWKGVSR